MTQQTFGNNQQLKNYTIGKFIGSGSYGVVYEVFDQDNNRFVAKIERNQLDATLLYESFLYKYMLDNNKQITPKYHGFVVDQTRFAMISDFAGQSLSSYFSKHGIIQGDIFISIFKQLVNLFKQMNQIGIVHRDVKAANMVIDNDVIRLIDFGLSQRFKKQNNTIYKEHRGNRRFVGTISFAPLASFEGQQQYTKDDIQSLCFTMIYVFGNKLPWSAIYDDNQQDKYNIVYEIKKKNITNDDLLYNTLCKGMPKIIPDTIVKTLNSVSFTTDEDFDEILKYEYKQPQNDIGQQISNKSYNTREKITNRMDSDFSDTDKYDYQHSIDSDMYVHR